MAESMRAAGAQSLFQVTWTETVDLCRLVEAATVRTGYSARCIWNIVVALNGVGDGESENDDTNGSN